MIRPEHWVATFIYPERYEVSSLGRVRRAYRGKGTGVGRVLKPLPTPSGYQKVCLWMNGKPAWEYIHRLVFYSFNQESDRELEIDHKNFNKSDNRLVNLELVTKLENVSRAAVAGRMNPPMLYGESAGNVKINEATALFIRVAGRRGVKPQPLMKVSGLSRSQVLRIINGESWRHLGALYAN